MQGRGTLTILVICLLTGPASAGDVASFYHEPQSVACGGRFNPEAMTAASRKYGCGTRLKVTSRRNGRSVVVTVNDFGPFVRGMTIDLSRAAARQIGMIEAGQVPVTIEVISR